MKKRMKTKRYADEGLVAEDKKRGLEASKDEKVGFFERLRMGNIDDPKSEAYKRFGAGRGAAERAKTTTPFTSGASSGMGVAGFGAPMGPQETIDRTPKGVPGFGAPMLPKPMDESAPSRMPASMPVGLRSAIEGAGAGEGGVSPGVKGPDQPVPRPKKQPKKASGYKIDEEGPAKIGNQNTFNFDLRKKEESVSAPGGKFIEKNVRTFRGMDRPDDRALGLRLTKSKIPITDNEHFDYLKKKNKERLAKTAENRAASGSTFGKMPGPSLSSDPYSMTLGSDLDPKSMMRRNDRLSGDGDFKKGGKVKPKVKKYASGGMVGKASKRADGIAKKGKTKGRII